MKKLISCVTFIVLVLYFVSVTTEVLTPKFENRYYALEDYLEDHPEDTLHDVQVFGSCHSYTSFNPVYMEERSGVSGFVYGNAGEIIPTTYTRMVDQFKKHTPKVALVEIWGINPYETYSSHERVFGFYLANNLERAEFSWAKQEVIWDFKVKEYQDINFVTMNFPFVNYKDRLLDGSLTMLDFDYDFTKTQEYTSNYTYQEMYSRFKNNGYKPYSSVSIEDYPQKQKTIEPGEMVEIELDIAKYIQKIIDLCKEKDVELIFYRSPYISTVNELKKLNHLKQICDENDVLFIDLEEEVQYDYTVDFVDYEHLSEVGANKSTEYLLPYIMEALGQTWKETEIWRVNLLINSDLTNAANAGDWKSKIGTPSVKENGISIELIGPKSAWTLYHDVAIIEDLWGTSVTASFTIADYDGNFIAPIISFRNADDKEISTAKCKMVDGKCIVVGVIPTGTAVVRLGVYAWDGGEAGDFVTLENVQLYQGAFSADVLSTVIQ